MKLVWLNIYPKEFNNKLCNFLNVHHEKDDNDDSILFSAIGNHLNIFRLPKNSSIAKTEARINLSESF